MLRRFSSSTDDATQYMTQQTLPLPLQSSGTVQTFYPPVPSSKFHQAAPDHLSPIDRSDCDTISWITPDLAEVRGKQRVSPSPIPIPRWLSPSPRAAWPSVAIMGPDGALAEPHDSEHVSQQTSKKLPFSFAPCGRPPASAPRSILSLSASAARRQQPGLATRPSTTRTRTRNIHGHGVMCR